MRRHLPNTLPHTDCTRRATAGRRNRYVRAAHIIYGTAAGNIIPATTVAPKYGNGSPVPVSGINFSYRIDHKKITDAAAIRLNSSKNSVKLRHYHVEYHRIRFIIRLLAPLSTATRRGNIIKFSRNSSCFQQNTSMQYDFCIFAESTLRTMPVPDTDLHHRFFRTRTSPNVTGIVLFYFRYVEFWWKSVVLRRTLSANYSIRAEDYFQSSIPFNHSESGRKEYYENMNISALFIENIPISCRKKGRPPISSRCFTKFNRDRNHNHDSAVPFFFLRFAEQVRE